MITANPPRQMRAAEERRDAGSSAAVTAFICANCARRDQAPDPGERARPEVPRFEWPVPVQEVLVPCAGRLQPEHVLKAFESGADLVCTVSCLEDDCQYLQGSERWARRGDYVRTILDQVGLGGERLQLFHLSKSRAETIDAQVAVIREEFSRALSGLPPNPLSIGAAAQTAGDPYQQLDTSDDASED